MNPTCWQVCIFAVSMGTGGSCSQTRMREVPLRSWRGGRLSCESLLIAYVFTWACLCAETPTGKPWLADYSPFQCPRITSDDLYLLWKQRVLLLRIC